MVEAAKGVVRGSTGTEKARVMATDGCEGGAARCSCSSTRQSRKAAIPTEAL